jgi:tetratricopeptide (TPR) repeat protein
LKSIFQAVATYASAFILVVSFGVASLFAQPSRTVPVHGQVTTADGALPAQMLFVEVIELGHRSANERVTVSANGDFDTHPLSAGNYEFRVVDASGSLLASENMAVGDFGGSLTIRLPDRTPHESPGGGVVSLSSLQHKVPKKARRELAKAELVMSRGELEESIKHLRAAIAIDPQYLEAYNNLGCRLIRLERPQEAVKALTKATELDPKAPFPLANLSAALLMARDVTGAESAARRALSVDPSSARAHYLLGLSLLSERKYTPEATQNIRLAAQEFPRAKSILTALEKRSRDLKLPPATLLAP